MTTFNLRGVTVTEGSSGANAVVVEKVVIRASDDYQVKYLRTGPLEQNDLAEVNLSPASGDAYQIAVGSLRLGEGWQPMVGSISWSGHKSQVMVIAHPGDVEKWTLIQLGGYPLPSISTVAQVKALFEAMTGVSGNLTGALAQNTAIDLRDLTGFLSASENDRIIADGRFDDWEGVTISTGIGNDLVDGVSANDRFELGAGNDTGIGGSGSDTMIGGAGKDSLVGESGGDLLRAGTGNDFGFGGTGNDRLYGDSGSDKLQGGNNADALFGGIGNDSLDGGTGNDVLTGGDGSDNFLFRKDYDVDRITDFQNGVDTLVLGESAAISSVSKALTFASNITGGVEFDFGNGDVLTVMGITKAAIADQIFMI